MLVAGALLDAEVGGDEDPYFMEEVQAGRILVSVEVPDAQAKEKAAGLSRESTPIEVDTLGTARLHAKLRHPQARRDEDSTEATSRSACRRGAGGGIRTRGSRLESPGPKLGRAWSSEPLSLTPPETPRPAGALLSI